MCILSVSQSLSVCLSRNEMDDDDCGWGREKGGRERRIIPSEYMMNVFIRLKLTGGGEWCAETERACMWVTPSTIISSTLRPLSVSLSSSQRETEEVTQVKRIHIHSFPFSRAARGRRTGAARRTSKAQLVFGCCPPRAFYSATSSRAVPLSALSLKRTEDAKQYDGLRGGRGGTQQPGWVTKPAAEWWEGSVYVCESAWTSMHQSQRGCWKGTRTCQLMKVRETKWCQCRNA